MNKELWTDNSLTFVGTYLMGSELFTGQHYLLPLDKLLSTGQLERCWLFGLSNGSGFIHLIVPSSPNNWDRKLNVFDAFLCMRYFVTCNSITDRVYAIFF